MKNQLRIFLVIFTIIISQTINAAVRPNGAGIASALKAKNVADVNSVLTALNLSDVNAEGLMSAANKTISTAHIQKLIDLAVANKADTKKMNACKAILNSAIQLNKAPSGMLAKSSSKDADASLIQGGFNNVVALSISSMDGTRGAETIDFDALTQAVVEFGRNAGDATALRLALSAILKGKIPAEADPLAELKNCK